jgi:hypothetical protein
MGRPRAAAYCCPLCPDDPFSCQILLLEHVYVAHSGTALTPAAAKLSGIRLCKAKHIAKVPSACTACSCPARTGTFGSQIADCQGVAAPVAAQAAVQQEGASSSPATSCCSTPRSAPSTALQATPLLEGVADAPIEASTPSGTGVEASALGPARAARLDRPDGAGGWRTPPSPGDVPSPDAMAAECLSVRLQIAVQSQCVPAVT